MSDKVNVDNPNTISSSIFSKEDRWAWLKSIPNKILRKRPIPSEQITDTKKVSKVTTSGDTVINEEKSPAASVTPSKPAEEPRLKEQQSEEITLEEAMPITTNKEESEKMPTTKRSLNISHTLQEGLTRLEMDVPEIETRGVPAIIGTNETVGRSFFEAIQAKHPDGYLVGVGSGSAYSMLHVFEDGVTPKGMILVDIDPKVVAIGRLLIQNLNDSNTAADFRRNFFGMPEEVFNQQLQKMIVAERNLALRRRWEATNADTWHKVWTDLSKREALEWEDIRAYEYEGQNIDVVGAILAKFDILKQLANEDNVTTVYADFTSPEFIEAVRSLPGFDSVTNVIYFSNVVDHITQRGTQMRNVTVMNLLKAYENPAHQAIYIDTLGQGLNYFLRARNSLAEFTEDDFRYRGIQPRSQKPEGLLFTDNVSSNP